MNAYSPITSLVDPFHRNITYLRLSVIDACNFRCTYCLPNGYKKSSPCTPLNLDEIFNISHAFAKNGVKKIRLTGGEPTLRKDLSDIIRICKDTPGIETVALSSNGYSLKKHIASYIDAGLDKLNISMDSLTPNIFEAITGHDKSEIVKTGIDYAIDCGIKKLKVNTVLLDNINAHELEDFINFVKHKPVSLRFIELMKTGITPEHFQKHHISGNVVIQHLLNTGWNEKPRSQHSGPAREYEHPDYQGTIGLIMPYSHNFCSDCNRVRVSSQGNLHTCLFSENAHPLRPLTQNSDREKLSTHISQLLERKEASHHLDDDNIGLTQNLSIIGG